MDLTNLNNIFQRFLINSSDENHICELYDSIINAKNKCKKIMMGLDCEFFNKNVALLQISFYNDESLSSGKVYIVRFYDQNNNYNSNISDMLTDIFIDQNIIKVGVNIGNDILYLLRSFYLDNPEFTKIKDMFINSSFDLQTYYMDSHKGEDTRGLVYLTKYYCDWDVSQIKTKQITRSNWREYNLSQKQLDYAFIDTVSCLEMGKKINILELNNQINNKIKLPKIRERSIDMINNIKTNNIDDNQEFINSSSDEFIDQLYKKYDQCLMRFFLGYSRTKIKKELYYNIKTQAKIKNKDGNVNTIDIGVISKDRYIDLLNKNFIDIIDGTIENPKIICYSKIYNAGEFIFDNRRDYDFTDLYRSNICFSCCSDKNLHIFKILPCCLMEQINRKYKEISIKYNIDINIYTVPLCIECFTKSIKKYIEYWNYNYKDYNEIFILNKNKDNKNIFWAFGQLINLKSNLKTENNIDIDPKIENEIKYYIKTYRSFPILSYNEIISLSKKELVIYSQKIYEEQRKQRNREKIWCPFIKQNLKEKKFLENVEKTVDKIVSDNKIEELILGFRSLFIDNILHNSLKKV